MMSTMTFTLCKAIGELSLKTGSGDEVRDMNQEGVVVWNRPEGGLARAGAKTDSEDMIVYINKSSSSP